MMAEVEEAADSFWLKETYASTYCGYCIVKVVMPVVSIFKQTNWF